MTTFRKMEGCGNDFVVLQATELAGLYTGSLEHGGPPLQAFVQRLCDRHYGIGADGLLAWESKSSDTGLHIRMHYWNADGSRAEMCGNGARCVVRAAWEVAGQPDTPLQLETDNGIRPVRIAGAGNDCRVSVDMGAAIWSPSEVPFMTPESTQAPALDVPVQVGDRTWSVSAVSMGNPHAIVFVDDEASLQAIDLHSTGRLLATHERFPRGANASFVWRGPEALHLRVWERGSGPTLACGTASCAALAVARRTARLQARDSIVQLPGGRVQVHEDEAGHLWLTGPATAVAEGVLHADWLALLQQPTS